MTPATHHAELKPSGAHWLGDVPTHWAVNPLWAMYRPKKITGHPQETLLSVYRDHGVIEKSSRDDNKNRESEDLSGYQLVVSGDLVTNKMKTWQGSIAVSNLKGIVSPAYYVYGKLHSQNDAYFHHLFRSVPYIAGYQSISKGIRVGQWDLEADKFRLFPVLVPPLPEQDAIVAYLDSAAARIDTLVAKKTRFIELLREKRHALIAHAVTNGLGATVPMKDSGVEWLGEVPAHWAIRKVSHAFGNVGSGTTPATGKREWYEGGTIPWITTGELRENVVTETSACVTRAAVDEHSALKIHPAGSLAIAMYGATIGRMGFLGVDATTNQACCVLSAPRGLRARFFYYWFLSKKADVISLFASGGAQPNINQEKIASLRFQCPSLDEQDQIIAHLDRVTSRIDALIAKTERSIELLREHRTALITAAVTGKIDLRDPA